MARTRFALSCALRHIFFNDFGLDRTFIMKDLASLVIYYADENTPAEIMLNYEKLTEWQLRYELMKQFQINNGEASVEQVVRGLHDIDVTALIQFVKAKATEAGDLTLEKLKGDNDKW
ncbi:MAG: hypothetical protein J6O53_01015 [Eubacterium sp.]|nr:hypothetical protein [Eubacterium sp.]